MCEVAAFPHGEGLDLWSRRFLNHHVELQFNGWHVARGSVRPFLPDNRLLSKGVRKHRNIWRLCLLLPRPLMPKSRRTKQSCILASQTHYSFVPSRTVFIIPGVPGSLNVISAADITQLTIKVRSCALLQADIHNRAHFLRYWMEIVKPKDKVAA